MKYVALLRGVNVGGRIIKMAELKACFEAMGFTDVKAVLQSGNATFESDEKSPATLKQKIEEVLTGTFEYPARVQVINAEDLKEIIKAYPFGVADASQHNYVIFIEDGLEKELVAEPCELAAGEKIQSGAGVIYWRVAKGQTLRSNLAKLLAKAKYKNFNTTRNLRTLYKLI